MVAYKAGTVIRRVFVWIVLAGTTLVLLGTVATFFLVQGTLGEGPLAPAFDAQIEGRLNEYRVQAESCPQWFREELFYPRDATWVYAGPNWEVTSFGFEQEVSAVQERITKELKQNGWSFMDTDTDGVLCASKGGGVCRWTLISIAEIGGETTATIQCSMSRGREGERTG